VAAFLSNTATLLNSGVPLVKALEALAMDDTFRKVAPTLEVLTQDIRAGTSLSGAMSKHPDSFSPLVVSLVRAGEAGGTLVPTLEQLAESIERRRETVVQLRQALTYPTIVTVLGVTAVGFLTVFVVPMFEETYAKSNIPLPSITVALLAVSRLVLRTWWMALGILVAVALAYRHFRNHPQVRLCRDQLLVRLPLLGPVVRTILVGRFAQAFGNLLSAGVSIKESLALTEQVIQHSEYAEMIRELRLAVARGEGIGNRLAEYRTLVPPFLVQMMSLGEKSGQLGNMVLQISRYTDKDLRRKTKHLSTLLEPVVTVMLAFAIGVVALAIYLPMFDMFKQVG
jgi:type IV pilus assembly protein PilC